MIKNIVLILAGVIVGLCIPKKSPDNAPPLPAVAQSQQQTAECTVSRETRPDGSIIDKIDFKSSQAGEQSVAPASGKIPEPKPENQFSAFAHVPIERPADATFNFMYGQKFKVLDIDGFKYHVGPGIDTKSTLKAVNGGISYEW